MEQVYSSFGQDINNRYELFLKSKQISDTDIFKFEADLRLSGEYAHKQRFFVLSSAGGSEVQWDWGVIFLGESVHQYYRIYTEDGKVLEARSGALVEMNKQNRSSEVPLFTHISVTLKAASVVFSSGIDSNDVTSQCCGRRSGQSRSRRRG